MRNKISPRMIEAGVLALAHYDPMASSPDEIVAAIYEAMRRERRGERKAAPPPPSSGPGDAAEVED
jgi:hypothetical protein